MCIRDRWYQRRVHGDIKKEMQNLIQQPYTTNQLRGSLAGVQQGYVVGQQVNATQPVAFTQQFGVTQQVGVQPIGARVSIAPQRVAQQQIAVQQVPLRQTIAPMMQTQAIQVQPQAIQVPTQVRQIPVPAPIQVQQQPVPVQSFRQAQSFAPVPTQSFAPVPTQSFAPVPTQSFAPVPIQSFAPPPTQSFAPPPAQYHPPQAPMQEQRYLLLNNVGQGWPQQEYDEEEDDEEEEEKPKKKKTEKKKKVEKKKTPKRKSGNKSVKRKSGKKSTKRKTALPIREQSAVIKTKSNVRERSTGQGQAPQQNDTQQKLQGGKELVQRFETSDNFMEWVESDEGLYKFYTRYSTRHEGSYVTPTEFISLSNDVAKYFGIPPPPADFIQALFENYQISNDAWLDREQVQRLIYIIFWLYIKDFFYLQDQTVNDRAYAHWTSYSTTTTDYQDIQRFINEMAEVIFNEYDRNKNGFIDKSELQQCVVDMVTELQLDILPESYVKESFERFDTNKDAQLSKEEFQEFTSHLMFELVVNEMKKEEAEQGKVKENSRRTVERSSNVQYSTQYQQNYQPGYTYAKQY
eukprot:TRINITY_DN713_c0_g1_i5.p1 TRINITY_DN713_c0_g1~~TRINITY_DN713_c0_g1_i5.p1  ORF type:complete len:574 (-),score=133.94 TRINITY_DN713_c0_g1_i5:40-1761(-)